MKNEVSGLNVRIVKSQFIAKWIERINKLDSQGLWRNLPMRAHCSCQPEMESPSPRLVVH